MNKRRLENKVKATLHGHPILFHAAKATYETLNLSHHVRWLLTRKRVYKYFPEVFLKAKHGFITDNTETYWSDVHRTEQTHGKSGIRFGARIYGIAKRSIDFTGKSILDVGCGGGNFLNSIDVPCAKHGVDISHAAVDKLKSQGIVARQTVLPHIPLEGPFDIVTSFETLEHLKDWKKTIDEMVEKVRPGGYLLISVPFEDRIAISEHVTYFDLDRLYRYLTPRIQVLEVKFLGPWFLFVCTNQKSSGEIPSYFEGT